MPWPKYWKCHSPLPVVGEHFPLPPFLARNLLTSPAHSEIDVILRQRSLECLRDSRGAKGSYINWRFRGLLAPDRLNHISRTCWIVSLFGCVVDAMLRESLGVIILGPLSESGAMQT